MVSLVVTVLHELQRFEVGPMCVEALEEERAGLDTANDGIASYGGGLRCSGLAQAFLSGFVGDEGLLECAFSVSG